MALKKFKPVTPGRRGMVILQHDRVTAKKPHKSLVVGKKRISGRNNQGRVTMRRRGGGHKRRYRIIDFCRDKFMVPGKVATIEYDPNRTSYIALVNYADGDKRYILASETMKVGDTVAAGTDLDVVPGNCMKLTDIPEGTVISQIELKPGRGAQLVRAAGSTARLMAKEGRHGLVRLPSGEMRLIPIECQATIGQVSNAEHSLQKSGKAGRSRWLGRRPKVRGVAMNPVDHPMGGGEGRGSGGRNPTTPWGKPTKGYKTRKRKKYSNRWIVKRRAKRKDSQ